VLWKDPLALEYRIFGHFKSRHVNSKQHQMHLSGLKR
jgi:hypothetical protein